MCFETKEVSAVLEQHKEEFIFMGIDDIHGIKNLASIVFFNKDTRTYSILLNIQDVDQVCVISSGVNGSLLIKIKD